MNDPLTQEELTSLRGVVGGLAWISRYGWADLVELALQGSEVTSRSLSRLIGLIGTILRSLPFPMPALQMKLRSRANRDASTTSRPCIGIELHPLFLYIELRIHTSR